MKRDNYVHKKPDFEVQPAHRLSVDGAAGAGGGKWGSERAGGT